MSESSLQSFSTGVASYLSSCIFPSIVQGLGNRNISVTVDELLQMTSVPSRQPAVIQQSSVPSMAFGGAVPMMASSTTATNARKTTATTAPIAGRSCMYQYKRGENKSKYCGKATAPGMDYCAACLKSRKNIQKEVSAGPVAGAAPGMGAIPGMAGLPSGYSAPVSSANDSASQGGQLSVVPYDENKGLFREPNHQFIVYQISPGKIAVLGRLSDDDNQIVPLNLQEQATAQAIGLMLSPDATTPTQTAIPQHHSIPSVPSGHQALPTITPLSNYNPSGADHTIPQIPQIPSF